MPVTQTTDGTAEASRLIQRCIRQRTAEEALYVPVLQTQEQVAHVPVLEATDEALKSNQLVPRGRIQERTMEEIAAETVKLIPLERVQSDTVEQIAAVPVPRIREETGQVIQVTLRERVTERNGEQIIDRPVPQTREPSAEVGKAVTQERVQQHTGEQTAGTLASQIQQKLVEVIQLILQGRISERFVERLGDVPAPRTNPADKLAKETTHDPEVNVNKDESFGTENTARANPRAHRGRNHGDNSFGTAQAKTRAHRVRNRRHPYPSTDGGNERNCEGHSNGCVEDNTRTCQWVLHQTKKIQRTRQKDWKMARLQLGSMRHDKSR